MVEGETLLVLGALLASSNGSTVSRGGFCSWLQSVHFGIVGTTLNHIGTTRFQWNFGAESTSSLLEPRGTTWEPHCFFAFGLGETSMCQHFGIVGNLSLIHI